MRSTAARTAAVLVLSALGCPRAGGASLEALPDGVSLVLAKVTGVQAQGQSHVGTQEITHVYSGAPALVGRTFTCPTAGKPAQGNTPVIVPLLSVGELGLWLVRPRDGRVQCLMWGVHGMAWPVRDSEAARYASARRIAEFLERLAKCEQGQVPALLKRRALGADAKTAAVAIRLTAKLGTPAAATILDGLLSADPLGMEPQVALDEALCAVRRAAWQGSPERERFLTKWVTAKLTTDEAGAAVSRLDALAQHGGIGESALVKLVTAMVANKDIPVAQRRDALSALGWAFDRFKDDSAAFKLFVDCIRNADERAIRLGAAYGLLTRRALKTRARQDMVRDLRGAARDKALADVLQKALDRSQEATRGQ